MRLFYLGSKLNQSSVIPEILMHVEQTVFFRDEKLSLHGRTCCVFV